MRAAIIRNTLVIDAVVLPDDWTGVEGQWQPPNGTQVVPSDVAGKGWTYIGAVFTPPPPNPDPSPTPDQLRDVTFFAQADRQDIVQRLQNATPAQIDTWLQNNVTNLAQARAVLGAIIKVLATMRLN